MVNIPFSRGSCISTGREIGSSTVLYLSGGFKHFLLLPLPGEMIQIH